ncbi:AraC family transcriptional regulator [Paenibacillus psychroresistens]|nr:AraC family transcriptional regulator [Paenibacillus psychroresistens]
MSLSHISFLAPNPVSSSITVLTAGSHITKPGHRVGAQIIDYCLIHHVVSGQGFFQCRGQRYTVSAGSSFFIFPDELVDYESSIDSPWHYYWVGFRSGAAYQMLDEMGISIDMPVVEAKGKRRISAFLRLIERHFLDRSAIAELQAQAYTQLLIAEYGKSLHTAIPLKNSNEGAGNIAKAIRWMNTHYHEPISIERLALTIGYHRSHMTRLFHKYTGTAPMTYLFQIRMRRAQSLLHGHLSIEQVAAATGYADPLYFSKQFKKWMGLTPTEYRNTRY